MGKSNIQFTCQECGNSFSKWAGRCSNCGAWNSLLEQLPPSTHTNSAITKGAELKPRHLKEFEKTSMTRIKTNISDIDSVLGGGFVPGSVSLVAGQPGIGKSTILIQIASAIANTKTVLYVSGEESAEQVGNRALRINGEFNNVLLVSSNNTEDIAQTILSGNYDFVVIDSIQTISAQNISSSPGSISQITNSTHILSQVAKQSGTTLVIVGHVTKEGSIAGPKLLEHLVDVVLNLEGDRYGGFKTLRAVKNRYGSTLEVGIFEMISTGLRPVKNPSESLLSERQIADGSVVLSAMEGARPILVEVQALVNKTGFGYPKRTSSGFDLNRLNLLTAVITRRTKLDLNDKDVYVNIVGGLRITEPAADLAVCMAIASAAKGMTLKNDAVVFGEVGLSGEIRHVPQIEKRLSEARQMGFELSIGPKQAKLKKGFSSVTTIKEAFNNHLKS